MEAYTYRFHAIDTIVDEVHRLFDEWESEGAEPPIDSVRTLYMLKVAVHEWVANLVQHAHFEDVEPYVALHLQGEEDRLRCHIDDNSTGFDLGSYYASIPEALQTFPERGTGLLILQSCTEDLHYLRLPDGTNRLTFLVSTDQDPWLSIQF